MGLMKVVEVERWSVMEVMASVGGNGGDGVVACEIRRRGRVFPNFFFFSRFFSFFFYRD